MAASARAANERSSARLAAVQALYQMELADAAAEASISDVLGREQEPPGSAVPPAAPDVEHLRQVVCGVAGDRAALDLAIAEALSAGHALDRLEVLLRVILQAGTYELRALPEIPFKVVINEYVELAQAFFSGKEPPLVNAVLDRLADRFRGDERLRAKTAVGEDG